MGRGGTYPSVGSVPVLRPAAGAAAAAGVADGRLSQLFRRFHCGVRGRLLEKGLSAHHVFLRVLHLLVRRPLPVLFSFARPPDGGQIPCAHRAPYRHGAADPAGLPEIRQAAAPRGQRLSEAELETPERRFCDLFFSVHSPHVKDTVGRRSGAGYPVRFLLHGMHLRSGQRFEHRQHFLYAQRRQRSARQAEAGVPGELHGDCQPGRAGEPPHPPRQAAPRRLHRRYGARGRHRRHPALS